MGYFIVIVLAFTALAWIFRCISDDLNALPTTINMTVRSKATSDRCVYCHDESWEFPCRCGATYHRECWNELKRCASLGCPRTKEQTDEEVRKKAYYMWTARGCKGGSSQHDWLEAERIILS